MLKKLSKTLGLTFTNDSLLKTALTHRSYGSDHNERLEFIGDSVLNLTITTAIYQQFPEASEGHLTRFRSTLVRGETLLEISKELGLSDYVRLGAGEMRLDGSVRDSILADVFEALVGAIFCDAGFEAAQKFVLKCYASRLKVLSTDINLKDPKTTLQERMQFLKKPLPEYRVVDLQKHFQENKFTVECIAEGWPAVQASGESRRKAEQAAAAALLEKMYGS